jgi:hypothetical protein
MGHRTPVAFCGRRSSSLCPSCRFGDGNRPPGSYLQRRISLYSLLCAPLKAWNGAGRVVLARCSPRRAPTRSQSEVQLWHSFSVGSGSENPAARLVLPPEMKAAHGPGRQAGIAIERPGCTIRSYNASGPEQGLAVKSNAACCLARCLIFRVGNSPPIISLLESAAISTILNDRRQPPLLGSGNTNHGEGLRRPRYG